jgi:hypothetical protein
LARPKKIAGFNLELLKATDFPKKITPIISTQKTATHHMTSYDAI